MNHEDYIEALAIIKKSLNTGKLLVGFKRWELLDTDARSKALFDSTCMGCMKIKLLVGTIELMFGTEGACKDCMDQNNPRLMHYRIEANI